MLALLALLALVPVGCNWNGDGPPMSHADSEGGYVQIGDVAYQVQLSRVLNIASPEDAEYFTGVPIALRLLQPDQEWFAIWMRAQSQTSKPRPMANDFRITDTLGTVYTPIPLPAENPLAYRARLLQGPGDSSQSYSGIGIAPDADSAAGRAGPVAGGVLIFRVSTDVYQNRPLVLHIKGPPGTKPAQIVLDL